MMHKKTILSLVLALVIVFGYPAYAQDTEGASGTAVTDDVKITIGYDSAFYGIKLFFERVRLTNAFTEAGKAGVSAKFAKRRMAEASLMLEKDNFEAVQELMQHGIEYITKAKEHAAAAVLQKDSTRTRYTLETVSTVQSGMLNYVSKMAQLYPEIFDTEPMLMELKAGIVDTMVVWTYLSYKENLFENAQMREGANAALDNALSAEGIPDIDAIASATISNFQEAGIELTQDEIDAIASATYQIIAEGGSTGGNDTDATSSATVTVPPDTQMQDGQPPVDAISSATTTTGPEPAPTDAGGGVDAVSSATPSNGGTTTTPGIAIYNDDDDEHEREHDDDEHDDDD